MKKLLILLATASLPFIASAQTNPALTDTTKYIAQEEYCVIKPIVKVSRDKVILYIDMGKLYDYTNQELRDANKKVVEFNSTVDALNYMARRGWLFVSTIETIDGPSRYILRRSLVK